VPKIEKVQVEFEGQWREEEVIVEEDTLPIWGEDAGLSIVGKPVPRVDGYERVSGKALYTCDVRLPGMLHGKILRSPHPHARIVSIDVRKAEALDGVVATMTYKSAPPISYNGDRPLFSEHLRYRGEEVAAVVAQDEYIAEDALALINVDYEVLPFVTAPEAALAPDGPEIYPGGNLHFDPQKDIYERGDMDRGLAEADVIVEAVYRTPVALHNCMETHGSVAHWVGHQVTVWDSTQNVFGVRKDLARALNLALHDVRVIKQYMGGGFGSKNQLGKYTILAALFSRMTGRPVRFLLDREEENLAAGNRPSAILECKASARKDGTLTALYMKSISAIGAYGSGGFACGGPFREMYRCPNVRTEQQAVHTNTGPARAFRAPGYVEGTFALECLLDELAEKLNMDPLKLRLANYAEENQARGLPYTSKGLREAYRVGAERIGWAERRNREPSGEGRFRRGIGMASQTWGGGGSPPSYAHVKINADGTADLVTGTQDIGTGTRTVLTQIAAEELGLRLEDIRISIGDTQVGPYSVLSAGSMTVASVGPAVRMAARDAKMQLLDLAAYLMEVPLEKLEIRDRMVYVADDPSERLALSEVAAKMGNYMIVGKGARGPNPSKATVNTFGAQFAEVEVDMETGQVRLLRITGQHDVGRVLNPLTASSQFEGGVIQGAGLAIMESRIVDGPTGYVLNANLEGYKIPTALDVPRIDVTAVDMVDPICNNLGAKGLGEPPIIPSAPAIANAIYNASGLRIRTLPITPKAFLDAFQDAEVSSERSQGGYPHESL
jgi:xanthine dehydrogenase YagR molybdenum-binding subunit